MFDDFATFTEENIGNDMVDRPYFFGSTVFLAFFYLHMQKGKK